MEAFISVITQNNTFKLEIESITSDDEIAMINAISEVFVGISRYNCYFHYKKNIVDKLRKKGFLKKKNKDERFKEVKEIINILGRLPLDYDGNMEYFNSITEDIKKRYPYINDFIDNYFIKYKKIHFENEAYNYNKILIDCLANSYLENYNLYLKKKLGRKYKLNWDVFINFIKQEFKRIKSILTENTEKNIKIFSKKTKFSVEKYTESEFKKKKINREISKYKNIITNFNWLKYSNNSCRYDVFCTFYIFSIYDFIEDNYNNVNNLLKHTHNLMKNILNNPTDDNRKIIWDYFINMQIDKYSTAINDKNTVVETGFGKSGYIIQLFKIFKNNTYFCLKEIRNEICEICSYNKNYPVSLHDHIIACNEYTINFKKIETIICYSLIYDGLALCEKCNLDENTPTSRIYYNITDYPNFLFVLFDFNSYHALLKYKDKIKNLLVENLEFNSNVKYMLNGIILSPYDNHFTYFINKIHVKNLPKELSYYKNYYCDDLMFENRFIEVEKFDYLFDEKKYSV